MQGVCKGSNIVKEVGSWISQNKPLVIGLAAGIGGLITLSLLACLWSCCMRRKHAKRKPTWPQQTWQQPGAYVARQGWFNNQSERQFRSPQHQPLPLPLPVLRQPTERWA